MTRRKLRKWVLPALSVFVLVGGIFCYYLINNLMSYSVTNGDTYVTNSIVEEDSMEVNNELEKVFILRPYNTDKVTVSKYFYQSNDEEAKQQASLIRYENIYMPNTGILYASDEEFDIIASLDGKVTNIKEDEILGNIVEIENSYNIITIYQSVKDVTVKVGDTVKQGDVIAKSGSNKLANEKENCLHFEIYENGNIKNPEEMFDKELN